MAGDILKVVEHRSRKAPRARRDSKASRPISSVSPDVEQLRDKRTRYYTEGSKGHNTPTEHRRREEKPVGAQETKGGGYSYVYPARHTSSSSHDPDSHGIYRIATRGSSSTCKPKGTKSRSQHSSTSRTKPTPARSKTSATEHGYDSHVRTTSSKPSTSKMVECLTCGEENIPSSKTAKLECGHRMCHSCLRRIFVLSTTDPAHMPPKCCTSRHIPLKHVDRLFDNSFKRLWNRKYLEYTTANRLYCPSGRCGHWIKPSAIRRDPKNPKRKYGLCKRCETKVCTLCNKKYHKTLPCPDDPATAAFIDSAKTNGWQQCFNCKAMVELKEGCNHMTCRCTAQFCMLCGSKWKTCACPWFANTNGLAPGDQLRHMRIPAGQTGRQPTYAEEIAQRRYQEAEDRLMAMQMQLEDDLRTLTLGTRTAHQHRTHVRPQDDDALIQPGSDFAVGNAASHHMNASFTRADTTLITNVVSGASAIGRRGESSRRQVARESTAPAAAGLAADAFGSASVLNAAGMKRQDVCKKSTKRRVSNFERIAKNGGTAQGAKERRIMGWLNRVEEEDAEPP